MTTVSPCLLGIPFDSASSYQRGPAEAPSAIRQALRSDSSNMWSESLLDLGEASRLHDAGDVRLTEGSERQEIEEGVRSVLEARQLPIVLGGDHSITYPVVRAFRGDAAFTIVHFDAHSDLYPEFLGDRYSHACPFARIMEEGLTDRLVQVGVRTMSGIQAEQVRKFNVTQVSQETWDAGWTFEGSRPVYLSIDIDVLDPAFAPGVSHPEPGGCSTRQLIRAIQQIRAPIIGADIVELNPRNDPAGLTARVAAKLLKEVAATMMAVSA
jgi:arginase